MIEFCAHVAAVFPVQIFGVSLTCRICPIVLLYGIATLTAFDLSNGSVRISSLTSMPFAPAIRACMLYKSMSGPLSSQSCIVSGPKQACDAPPIFMTLIFATSHPDFTSAVPCTNSAFSSMYSSPQLMTNAPSPTENATRRMVATSGVNPLRVSNKRMIHLFLLVN